MRALSGVGDQRKQVFEKGITGDDVMHLKRRLNHIEDARIGPVTDIRGTPDALRRMEAMALVTKITVQQLAELEPGVL